MIGINHKLCWVQFVGSGDSIGLSGMLWSYEIEWVNRPDRYLSLIFGPIGLSGSTNLVGA